MLRDLARRDELDGLPNREAVYERAVTHLIDQGWQSLQRTDRADDLLDEVEVRDLLADIGDADITSHVDFQQLANEAGTAGAKVFGPLSQGEFLRALGIDIRARQLAAEKTPLQTAEIFNSLKRLIDDTGMGSLFKVLAIAHPDQPCPEGFAGFE